MSDPSSSVSPQLLHHLHALCVMKYPLYQSIQPELLVEMLLKTPTMVQQYPFTWTMIESPPPGSLMLSWHPPAMGTSCASDGYVWADAESVHTVDVKGYSIEIYYHKAGFNPNPNLQSPQTHALFSRRCYRLKPQHPSTPAEASNLWLLHYLTAERQNQIPVPQINITQGARQSFNARSYIAQLFATGQLPRKEFYLGDRNSWPIIALPTQVPQAQGIQMVQQQQQPQTPQQNRHISPMNPRGTPQPGPTPGPQGYYTPARAGPAPKGAGPVPPSAKRLKPTPPGSHPGASGAQAALGVGDPGMTIDEEEDTSRGDMLDHLTPREIATTRYIQHHEWMEEVLGSVYAINRIKPVDLGLGLRGELESVTKGLLEAPVYPTPPSKPEDKDSEKDKDQKEILELFRPRVEQKIADIEADIQKMEMLHAARLQKISKSGIAKEAERKLRSGMGFGSQERPATATSEDEPPTDPLLVEVQRADTATASKTVDEIVAEVETAIGKKVVEKNMLLRWDLPVEEIEKMGGVVAGGNGAMDTVMGGEERHTNGDGGDVGDVGDEYVNLDLSVGIPESGISGDNDVSLVVGFQSGDQDVDGLTGEELGDTIMDDFMNVDSKSDMPAAEEKKDVPDVGLGEEKEGGDTGIPGLGLMEEGVTGTGL